MLNSERVLWLSQVCDVRTDPSAEAFLPTVMTVHSSRRSRAGSLADPPAALVVCADPAAGKRSSRAKSAGARIPERAASSCRAPMFLERAASAAFQCR
jgi:hypothetical protein